MTDLDTGEGEGRRGEGEPEPEQLERRSLRRPRGRPRKDRSGEPEGERAPKRSQAGGAIGQQRITRRKQKVAQTLRELADLIDDLRARGDVDPRTFADLLRADADQIASSVAYTAEKLVGLGALIDRALGHGGPVTVLQGFLSPARWVINYMRQKAAEREPEVPGDAAAEWSYTAPAGVVAGDGSPGPADAA